MDTDQALRKVGGYKRFHLWIFMCLGLSSFSIICNQGIGIIFVGYEPSHHCKVPENQTLNETIPGNSGQGGLDQCHLYQNLSVDNSSVPCDAGWQYYSDGYSTIVTEWDLVCSKNYMVDLSQILFQCCWLLSEFCVSYLGDRYGRKPVHISCLLLTTVTGTIVSQSVNLSMFIVFRCVTAILMTASVESGATLMLELFDSEKRTFAGISSSGLWVTSLMPLGLFAWAIPNWRHLQLALSLVNVVWVCYIWLLPESVPWLVATGREQQAEEVLKKMAKWNKVQLDKPIKLAPKEKLRMHDVQIQNDEDYTTDEVDTAASRERDVAISDVFLLFKDRLLRKHIIVCGTLWSGNSAVYYALLLVSPMLPGNRFINYFILIFIEAPAYVVSYFVVKRYGRRMPMLVFNIIAAIPLAAMAFLPARTASGTDLIPLSMALMAMGKFGISGSFSVMVLLTKEVFPTPLRATSSGMCAGIGRVGTMLSSLAVYAAKTRLSWLPTLLCSVISILVGFLTLLLPETNHKPLPQTRDDVRRLYLPASQQHTSLPSLSQDIEEE